MSERIVLGFEEFVNESLEMEDHMSGQEDFEPETGGEDFPEEPIEEPEMGGEDFPEEPGSEPEFSPSGEAGGEHGFGGGGSVEDLFSALESDASPEEVASIVEGIPVEELVKDSSVSQRLIDLVESKPEEWRAEFLEIRKGKGHSFGEHQA